MQKVTFSEADQAKRWDVSPRQRSAGAVRGADRANSREGSREAPSATSMPFESNPSGRSRSLSSAAPILSAGTASGQCPPFGSPADSTAELRTKSPVEGRRTWFKANKHN